MRTTVTMDDEVHEYAAYYARARGLTLSAAVSELIRKARNAPTPAADGIRILPNGFPIFPPTGRTITIEDVKRLEEEEFEPK
ncbi:MAG: hypothetical protein WBD67_03045 [Terracidiphilus sp.]